MAWLAESLRFTAFVLGEFKPQQNYWQRVVGAQPDESLSRKSPLLDRESGRLATTPYTLTIDSQPGRLDLYLTAFVDDPNAITAAPPFIGEFPNAQEAFEPIVYVFLSVIADVNRIAIGSILLNPAENKEGGYITLQNYLPNVEIDPVNSSEFIYGINRPRKVQFEGREYEINRISKWSANTLNLLQVRPDSQTLNTTTLFHAARLELDISSSVDNKDPMDSKVLAHLFREFQSNALEIAEKGDVK